MKSISTYTHRNSHKYVSGVCGIYISYIYNYKYIYYNKQIKGKKWPVPGLAQGKRKLSLEHVTVSMSKKVQRLMWTRQAHKSQYERVCTDRDIDNIG